MDASFENRSVEKYTNIIGIVAGICTSISLLPQLIKMFREKKAGDLSLIYLMLLFIGLCLWIYYGYLREDFPIIITNSFSATVNLVVIILGVVYKKRDHQL